MSTNPNIQDIANPPVDNPAVFVNLGVATIDGTIPVENLPVGTDGNSVAAGNDPRFPATLTEVPSRAREVWIAADPNRTEAGNGTYEDPYDGSTQAKFDALLNALPASIVINLLPGMFSTLGSGQGGNVLKEGWIIQGAGIDLTTVFLNPQNAGTAQVTHFGFQGGQMHRLELRNLTLNGNVENQPTGALVQANMACNVGGFYNVRLSHWGNAQNANGYNEAFGLVLTSGPGNGDQRAELEIRGCFVDAAIYSGGSCLGINAGGTGFEASGVIENNVIYDNYTSAAIAMAGCFRGVRVAKNHVAHAQRGFHQDTAPGPGNGVPSQDVRVEGNYFEACIDMVGLGSQGNSLIHNYTIANNTHTLTSYHGASGYGNFTPVFIDSGVTGTIIAGNRIGVADDFDPTKAESIVFLVGAGCGDVTIINNVVDPSLVSGAAINAANGTKLISCWGNRYANGTAIPGLPDQGLAPTFAGAAQADAFLVAGNPVVVEGTHQTNYIGRCRLRFSAALPSEYIFQSPEYLVRLHHQDSVEATALVTVCKAYQGNVVVQTQGLSGSRMLVTATNLSTSTATTDTVAGQSVYRLHPSVTFSLSTPASNAEYMTVSVTPLGSVANTGGDGADPTTGPTAYAWTIEAEDNQAVINGTAAPNVFPVALADGDPTQVGAAPAPVVQVYTGTSPVPTITGSPARFVYQSAPGGGSGPQTISLPRANSYAAGAELRIVDAHGYTATVNTESYGVTYAAQAGDTLHGTASLSGAGAILLYSDGVSAWTVH